MKWRYVDKMDNWVHRQYWVGRKKGATIEVWGDESHGFGFLVNRDKDGLVYNSLWDSHPNPIAPLIKVKMKGSQESIFEFIEQWVETYVPKLTTK